MFANQQACGVCGVYYITGSIHYCQFQPQQLSIVTMSTVSYDEQRREKLKELAGKLSNAETQFELAKKEFRDYVDSLV